MRKRVFLKKSVKRKAAVCFLLFLLSIVLLGCSIDAGTYIPNEGDSVNVEKIPVPDINSTNIYDRDSVYMYDDEESVVTMYLTVRKGNKAEGTNHTWEQINMYSKYDYENMGVDRYKVEGLLQVGDENGPVAGELGFGLKVPNSIVQIRGWSTSRHPQKSYKITLKENAGEWRDQRTIALNKHVYDGLRFRNKLSYDLIKGIPDMISLRTQFVHLYVKDETKEVPDKGFVDYGLYTQVEQPNTRFLRNHGLDTGAHFYKINFFEFFRYEDVIKLESDPTFNKVEFEKLLETKGNNDHSKLIKMLEDLNDYTKPIEPIFEKYFNADNYFTWLAFNILTGNIDTQSRNFYLYSPLNSDTWYFIAWDCDDALRRQESTMRLSGEIDFGFETGISNYWGSVLHNRVLRNEKYLKMLDDKIKEMKEYLSADRITAMTNKYRAVVEPYVYSMPDVMYARLTQSQYDSVAKTLADEVEISYKMYLEDLKRPRPFYLDVPLVTDNGIFYRWDIAHSEQESKIKYSFELARDHLFEDLIYKEEDLLFPEITLSYLEPGQYFFRVIATNDKGYSQKALAYYVGADYIKRFGVLCFYVLENGEVEVIENAG